MYPALIENALRHLSRLPGIGEKTSLRLLLHLLRQDPSQGLTLAQALKEVIENIAYCPRCHGLSQEGLCQVCRSSTRNQQLCCVVAEVHDMLAIESTQQYQGTYHVLGGLIKPLQQVSPDRLSINHLMERVTQEPIQEIILALSDTSEGGLTMHYLSKKLSNHSIQVSCIARGIPLGGELEYTDTLTLGRSITDRRSYEITPLNQ